MPNFPSSLDSLSNPGPTTLEDAPGFSHSAQHAVANDCIEAIEAKLGIGSSVPTTPGDVLRVTASGTTMFGAYGVYRIAQTVLGAAAASITFSSIPNTYEALMLLLYARSDGTGTNMELRLRCNGDTSGNYLDELEGAQGAGQVASEGVGTTFIRLGYIPALSATASLFGSSRLLIPGYARTVGYKAMLSEAAEAHAFTTGSYIRSNTAGFWLNTAAIATLLVYPQTGNFIAGTVATLYGLPAN